MLIRAGGDVLIEVRGNQPERGHDPNRAEWQWIAASFATGAKGMVAGALIALPYLTQDSKFFNLIAVSSSIGLVALAMAYRMDVCSLAGGAVGGGFGAGLGNFFAKHKVVERVVFGGVVANVSNEALIVISIASVVGGLFATVTHAVNNHPAR